MADLASNAARRSAAIGVPPPSKKKMPDKLRSHFMLYRAKISIYLDTIDFGEPMMLDITEVLDMAPEDMSSPAFLSSLGPVRPGADSVWMEAAVAHPAFAGKGVVRIGAMIHNSRSRGALGRPSYSATAQQYFIEPYVRDHDGLSRSAGPDFSFRIDASGRIEWCGFVASRSVGLRSGVNPFGSAVAEDADGEDLPFSSSDPAFDLTRAIAVRALFCLALTNCKNITLRPRKYNIMRGEGPQGGSFHELLIGAPQSKSTGKMESSTAENRAHLARGHFKTFTADAPLLGRHVGTYWWGWQVRGDAEKGIVAKSYKLTGHG